MKTKKQEIGAWGEQEAARFLLEKGYHIIEQNFRTRRGEIDIIAWHIKQYHGKTLCFIEVKTRSYENGSAERATGKEKQARMQAAAREYCLNHDISIDTTPIQFEQISVYIRGYGVTCIQYVIPVI